MLLIASLIVVLALLHFTLAATKDDDETARLLAILEDGLNQRGSWLSVHAAEDLAFLGKRDPVITAFAPQAESATPPFRIGVWRVLALSAPTPAVRDDYVQRIRGVLLDAKATDRLHAMEALAKIAAPIASEAERRYVTESAASGDGGAPFALWRLSVAGDSTVPDRLADLLRSSDAVTRFRAAYVLGRLRPLKTRPTQELADALAREPHDSLAWPAIASASGGRALADLAANTDVAARRLAADALAHDRDAGRLLLEKLSRDEDTDVRIAAAFGLLAQRAGLAPSTTRASQP
jgi:hypothetical protein